MTKIIQNAPIVKENIVVFRGKKTKKTYRGFPSYTLDPSIADHYASNMKLNKKGVIEIMKIHKGTPVLLLESITEYPGEYEILVDPSHIVTEKGKVHKLQFSHVVRNTQVGRNTQVRRNKAFKRAEELLEKLNRKLH